MSDPERPYDIAASNARENDYWSQVHFPEFWRCAHCGVRKDEAKGPCTASPWIARMHSWRRNP